MRSMLVATLLVFVSLHPAEAQVSVEFGGPAIAIGINVETYPTLVQVPGYPVYYDPRLNSNYFFYDGLYWVYAGDTWYASSWYNGPWQVVAPEAVPLFILRVPVRYYRSPPAYFRGWQADTSPRWGEHWGHGWEERRAGWDRWDRNSVPAPAPLPVYQRQYTGAHYPRAPEQQRTLRAENYRYEPHEAVTQQHYQQPTKPAAAPHAEAPRSDGHPQAAAPPHAATALHQPPATQRPQTQAARPEPKAPVHENKPAPPPQEKRAPVPQKVEEPKAEEHSSEHR